MLRVCRSLSVAAGLILSVGSLQQPALLASPEPSAPAFRPGRILVQPKARANLAALNAARGDRVVAEVRDPDLKVIEVQPGQESEAIVAYQRSGQVEFAEPDYILRAFRIPNDPGYLDGSLWGLHNTGQNGGLAGADLGAEQAWDLMDGAPDVIVAVIDSGIRYTHEDLADNMWVNPGEIPGNGLDDDDNGIIDDVHGYNAYSGTGDPKDPIGHGTHVAGIIGAVGNNQKGTVGVAWKVKLMACRFMDRFGEGATSDAILSIDYARRKGAQIINASWGGSGFSLALRNAIRRARDAGIVFVVAAGNEAIDLDREPSYPAGYSIDNVVAVAATTRNDVLADYSNSGVKTVLLAAPGSDIYSTWHSSDRSYSTETGTSMATPFVAGVFAMAKARFPDDSYSQLIGRVAAAVDPLPGLDGFCATGGRVSLRKALGVPDAAQTQPARLSVSFDGALSSSARFRLSGEPGATYVIEISSNLSAWYPLITKNAAADGTLTFSPPNDMADKQRFFRARLVPVQ